MFESQLEQTVDPLSRKKNLANQAVGSGRVLVPLRDPQEQGVGRDAESPAILLAGWKAVSCPLHHGANIRLCNIIVLTAIEANQAQNTRTFA